MRHPWSIARRIAVLHVLLVGVIALFTAWAAVVQARDVAFDVERRHVLGVSELVAADPVVVDALRTGDPAAAQARVPEWVRRGQVSWLTVLDRDGTRVASWLQDQVGTEYPRSLDAVLRGEPVVEISTTGTAGRSVRAVVPVRDPEDGGAVVGALTMGLQVDELSLVTDAQLPRILLTSAAMAAVGVLGAWFVGRYLHRVTLGRGPEEIAQRFLLAETVMDSLEAGVVLVSPTGRVRLHNDAAARLLGWAGAAPPTVPEAVAQALPADEPGEATLAVGERVLVLQQRVVDEAGHARGPGAADALAAAAREGVTTAPPGSRVLTVHDRTDLRRLGDELSVATTLGTALRAQTHEHANRLHTALSLVESGRLDAAKAVLAHRDPQDDGVDDVVAALLQAKAAEARERGVELSWSARMDAPSPLGPLDALTVLGNLVDNAIDAAAEPTAPEDARWVDVELACDEAGLLVQVADGGPGPDAAATARLFERGWSTKPAGAAGRGMGLWLTRRIAEEAGGAVEVATDSGTVFTVEVPAAGPAPAERPVPAEREGAS